MTTEEIITSIFIEVDDTLPALKKHSQAKLYPSELVTIGLLFALKGVSFRAFYRWLKRDYVGLFTGLPERTRLQRLLKMVWLFVSPTELFHCHSFHLENPQAPTHQLTSRIFKVKKLSH
jgi:hypothetical protein